MSFFDNAKRALEDAGEQLKADLWTPEDKTFLEARAKDLVELAAKAATSHDPAQRAGYLAAARDTVISVKILAIIRMEATGQHIIAALEKLFWSEAVPRLTKALPALHELKP